jgi:hypothetical protein
MGCRRIPSRVAGLTAIMEMKRQIPYYKAKSPFFQCQTNLFLQKLRDLVQTSMMDMTESHVPRSASFGPRPFGKGGVCGLNIALKVLKRMQ